MQAHMAVAHFAVDFGLGHQCCYGVNDDDIHSAAVYQGIHDIQRLLAGVRLGNQQLVNIYAEFFGIDGVKRMLSVNECRDTAVLLSLSNHVEGNGGFTGRFRAVDFDDTATGNTANPQGDVQRQDARGDDFHIHPGLSIPQTHYRTFAKVLFYFLQGTCQGFFFAFQLCFTFYFVFLVCCHFIRFLSLVNQLYYNSYAKLLTIVLCKRTGTAKHSP